MAKQRGITARGVSDAGDSPAGNGVPDGGTPIGDIFGDGGDLVIDPAALDAGTDIGSATSGTNLDGTPRKRRGRKPGSGNASKKAAALDISGVEKILFSAHMMLAHATGMDELSIDQSEANQLASAVSNVARHYAVEASQVTLDWVNLVMALGMIYGTRGIAIRNNRKKKPQQHSNVVSLGG